jgi:hypothetical protein
MPTLLDESLLSTTALDQRLAIVGTTGSGKTYTAKVLVERLLVAQARVCIVDPLGVWWGLRAAADGGPGPFDLVIFGGARGDHPLAEGMGAALGQLVASRDLSCVVDLSRLGSDAAQKRFMRDFLAALYTANTEPLHLVLDEADLWAPQRPMPDTLLLFHRVGEIVRRGRVLGFIPWLITQRPAVLHKDVLSQADVLMAMKLTSPQDRNAIAAWIELQADRDKAKELLGALPSLKQGEGFLWAPALDLLQQVKVPAARTFDSSRTPKRGERAALPALRPVDVASLAAALEAAPPAKGKTAAKAPAAAPADARALEEAVRTGYARGHAAGYSEGWHAAAAKLRGAFDNLLAELDIVPSPDGQPLPAPAPRPAGRLTATPQRQAPRATAAGDLPAAARKLILALVQHAPARFTWGQAAALAGLKPRGGHFNEGRRALLDRQLAAEGGSLVAATPSAVERFGAEAGPAPTTRDALVELWASKLTAPAPEILRLLASQVDRTFTPAELAARLGLKPIGGHWNSGLAQLRNNGLAEREGNDYRASELIRGMKP